jgi:hypothetical protein
MVERVSGAKYIALASTTLVVQNFPNGDRGRANALGMVYLCRDVGKSLEAVFKAGAVDDKLDLAGPFNQAVNFRTMVHEHMHLHGQPFDGTRLRNERYVTMLETVNDLSAVYLAKDYAEALGLQWKVSDGADIRSPGYSYYTHAMERIFRAVGKTNQQIRALVLEAKATKQIGDYEKFFKAATGKKFAWSFSSMLENSDKGKGYLRKFEELAAQ